MRLTSFQVPLVQGSHSENHGSRTERSDSQSWLYIKVTWKAYLESQGPGSTPQAESKSPGLGLGLRHQYLKSSLGDPSAARAETHWTTM